MVCYELLQDCEFGFIHQILSYYRVREEQVSSFVIRCKAKALDELILLIKYGSIYLPKELEDCKKNVLTKYYRDIGRNILRIMKKDCHEYHKNCLNDLDYSFNKVVLNGILIRLHDMLKKPIKILGRMFKKNR